MTIWLEQMAWTDTCPGVQNFVEMILLKLKLEQNDISVKFELWIKVVYGMVLGNFM